MLATKIIPPFPSGPPTTTTLYVRSGGDDAADGLSVGNALATLEEVNRRLPDTAHGERFIVDIGGDHTIASNFHLKVPLALEPVSFDLAPSPHRTFLYTAPLVVRSVPTLYDTLDAGYTELADPTHGMVVITDATKAWTVNEHRGRMVVGQGFFEWGVIISNTATQLVVAHSGGMTGTLEILGVGSTLTIGDPGAVFSEPGFQVTSRGHVVFQGIAFRAPAATSQAMMVRCPGDQMTFAMCDFDGITLAQGDMAFFESCYFSGKPVAINGQPTTVRNCGFYNVDFNCHGTGGNGTTYWFSNRIDSCGPVLGGNTEFEGGWQLENQHINNGDSHGITYNGGPRATLKNTVIENCLGDAVLARNPGRLGCDNVDGAGNSAFGIRLQHGVQVHAPSSSVTGASGDLSVGALGATAYGALPANDYASGATAQGCRATN